MKTASVLSPLSIAGLCIAILGAGLAFSDLPQAAVWTAMVGVYLAERGIGKTASVERIWVVLGSAALLSVAAGMTLGPLLEIGVLLVFAGHWARGWAFLSTFGTAGYWFLDPLFALPGLILLIIGALKLHGLEALAAWALVAYGLFECVKIAMGALAAVKAQTHLGGGYRVDPGKPAPDFKLTDQEGFPVGLSTFKGLSHVLLIFVRGDWCPSCHITLRTYAKNKERFQQQGITLLAIGPDPVGVNQRMVQELGVPFKMLSDEGQRTAMAYGVQVGDEFAKKMQPDGVPLPASFLVDKGGLVRYTSRPERVGEFLDPNTIFPVLQALGA
jgi:peroxiredoxin